MARVTILTHNEFTHRKSGVVFRETRVANAEGAIVHLGVAEVPDAVARAHFVGHPAFRVEGLAPEPAPAPETKPTTKAEKKAAR